MDISRKTDYALRMLAALVRDPSGVVSVRTAARENGVPYSFARSIQHDLAVAGIVENTRGANGGMRLSVDPRQATLLTLVEAVQGPVAISCCSNPTGDGEPCPKRQTCHFSPVWCNAELLLRAFFSSVTLHELVCEGRSPLFRGTFEVVGDEEARAAARLDRADAPGAPSALEGDARV